MAKWLLVLALAAVLFGFVRVLARRAGGQQNGQEAFFGSDSGIDPAVAVRATILLLAALLVAYQTL